MERDKSKDYQLFDCKQRAEYEYVASLYVASERPYIKILLRQACEEGKLKYTTYMDVYQLVN